MNKRTIFITVKIHFIKKKKNLLSSSSADRNKLYLSENSQ